MKKIFSGFVFSGLVFLFLFNACDSGTKSSDNDGFDYTESGLAYKFHIRNDSALQAEVGKLAFVNMIYGSDDTILYDTKVIPPDGLVPIPLEEPAYEGDFMEGLAMMHLGDSATFIVNSDSFFLKTARYPELPDYALNIDNLTFEVKMVKVMTQEEARADYQKQLLRMQLIEDSVLQAYLVEKNITTKPDNTGLIFQDTRVGIGPLAKKGDLVTVEFSILSLDGTEIFSTKQQGEPVFFELGQPFDTKGMDEALLKMRKGGQARIIMPSNLAFGEQGRGNLVPPYTTLISDIELVDIKSKKEYSDEQQGGETGIINKYLKDNGITASPTASGLYYIEREKGTGPAPQTGDKVKVWYTGKLVDGTVFDASENRGQPYEFALGQGRVIKGWDEGIALMKQGGKATLIIPSKLGYGERGSGQRIPPFSPLVFEVELQGVTKQ
jgi:peptidylprolyl isomerase